MYMFIREDWRKGWLDPNGAEFRCIAVDFSESNICNSDNMCYLEGTKALR